MVKNIEEKQKRLVLLDSHAILHRAYHALPDFSTAKGEPTGALYGLSTMIIKIVEDLKPDYVVACYDMAAPTYRHEAYKEYKAGRQKTEDDLIMQIKRSYDVYRAMNIPIYEKAGFEADDMLGTIVEQIVKDSSANTEVVIASGDMDTLQLVRGEDVKVYTLKKGIKDTIIYDEKAVMERFSFGPLLIPDYKGLRGDPSDNIVGVKGIGEKTATILITTFGTIENIYKELEAGHEEAFKKAGITPRIIQLLKDNKEEAEFSKMLATIRRDAPIEFKLPEKTFKEALDVKKANALWTELEFRTLTQRLEKAVSGAKPQNRVQDETEVQTSQTALFQAVPAGELEITAVALWLINSDITNPKIEDIMNYANVDDFQSAKKKIFDDLDKLGLRNLYEKIELPLIPIMHKMKEKGVKIDRAILQNLSKEYHATLSSLEEMIWKDAGMEFNINSPKQLGEVLFDKLGLEAKNMKKTAGGARSTRESELEKLRDLHPIVPNIFEYRELQKLLSTYIDAIPPLLDDGGRLHAEFIPAGTTTGRMASQNPNLQNIPIKSDHGKKIRDAFIAEKGFLLGAFDYSQMELRIAAFLSGDEKLIGIFNRGEDVHTSVASFVFKVPQDKVTKDMRRQAKVINFGIMYGMGVLALKQNLGSTREEAQNYLNQYFETFSGLAKYLDRIKSETAQKGFTETYFGRRRYFQGIKSKIPYIRAGAERMAINAPIQGTEADVIKLAISEVDRYIEKEGLQEDVFLTLQVHDELVYEMRESAVEKVAPQIQKIMESVIDPKEVSGVVLKASYAVGKNWGELK
ncbi:MAG: DNA polymerase [Candidatus Taylorbacteria bacterium]